jgi:hypothetical protein
LQGNLLRRQWPSIQLGLMKVGQRRSDLIRPIGATRCRWAFGALSWPIPENPEKISEVWRTSPQGPRSGSVRPLDEQCDTADAYPTRSDDNRSHPVRENPELVVRAKLSVRRSWNHPGRQNLSWTPSGKGDRMRRITFPLARACCSNFSAQSGPGLPPRGEPDHPAARGSFVSDVDPS